jgi:hypothetical protein
MDSLVQNHHPLQNVSARDESSLGGLDDFLGHPSDAVCTNFGEDFKAHVQETNRSVLFDAACIFVLGQECYYAKIVSKKRQVSVLELEEHGHHVFFYSIPEYLIELGRKTIGTWGFVLFRLHDCFLYFYFSEISRQYILVFRRKLGDIFNPSFKKSEVILGRSPE